MLGFASDSATPEPRRLSLTLPRPLWIVGTVIALTILVAGWWGIVSIQRQRLAVREIERLGGRVFFGGSTKPQWVRMLLGNEPLKGFDDVSSVWLTGGRVTDADLTHLLQLTSLKTLTMQRTDLGDCDLSRLKDLPDLTVLWLDGAPVTDAHLIQLKELPHLLQLGVGDSLVTDAGLEHLKEFSNLKLVQVYRTKVTEAGVADLQKAKPRLVIRTKRR